MTSPDASTADIAPDVAIRARPPSPRRLSRKVLLGGAIAAGAVIAFALAAGLSEQPSRRAESRNEAVAAASGPPQSIAQGPSRYDALLLRGAHGQEDAGMSWDEASTMPSQSAELDPPGAAWRDDGARQAAPASAQGSPDPEHVARASAILFDRAQAHPETTRSMLDASLRPPPSRYTLQAGAIIPAALVTGLNSDLPGRVIAQVTQPVYDSVTGSQLLIPQGARLVGAYDNNGVRYGDRRILLSWDRLIMPNGWSIELERMPATDAAGAAGLADRTDNHLDRLALAIGLSAVLSVVANEAEGGEDSNSLSQSVGDAAAQQAAQTGARIVDRELAVRPSLTVRPGASVRVLVTRDIVLRPYTP